MEGFRVLEVKKSVYEGNDRRAQVLRDELRARGVYLVNLMSSPGSGKTTTITRTLESLTGVVPGVIEADLDSDVDAQTIARTGTRVVQVHSGGMCHLDADMTRQGLDALGTDGLDLVILENIGNLICTAEFDTGAALNVAILSVPEGDDKPLKYPVMFQKADVLLVNKIDAAAFFEFDQAVFEKRVRHLNPNVVIFPLSAKTGEGVAPWARWLEAAVKAWQTD
jgi:hydrogenase nickel incorporation protein HypB